MQELWLNVVLQFSESGTIIPPSKRVVLSIFHGSLKSRNNSCGHFIHDITVQKLSVEVIKGCGHHRHIYIDALLTSSAHCHAIQRPMGGLCVYGGQVLAQLTSCLRDHIWHSKVAPGELEWLCPDVCCVLFHCSSISNFLMPLSNHDSAWTNSDDEKKHLSWLVSWNRMCSKTRLLFHM